MAVYELDQGRTLQDDGKTKRFTAVFEITDVTSQEQAKIAPGVPQPRSLLNPGTPHPADPKLRCDSVSLPERLGPTTFRLTAYYSNNGSFTFPTRPPQPDTTAQAKPGYDIRWKEIEIPTFVKERIGVPNASGGYSERDQWVRRDYKRRIPEFILYAFVYVPPVTLSQLQIIVGKVDHLHTLADQSNWRFEGGTLDEIDATTTKITYTWSKFNPVEFSREPAPAHSIYPETLFFDYAYYVIPSQSLATPPQITTVPILDDENTDGWRTLPGAGRL